MKNHDHQANRVSFEEPVSLAMAKERRTTLIEEISDISAQLSNRNKLKKCPTCEGVGCNPCNGNGSVRVSNMEYHQWRQGAITALRARENTLRRLNNWMEERGEDVEHTQRTGTEAPVTDADTLLKKAYETLLRLRDDLEGDLDAEEMDVINSLGNYLNPQRLRKTGA